MDSEQFTQTLPLIDRAIRHVVRRARLTADQRTEFTSVVLLKLIEDNYAVLRAFRGQCAMQTYLVVVVRRCLLDFRVKQWGRWRASQAARRLGSAATALEQMVVRDGLPVREAVATVAQQRERWGLSSGDAWRLHEALPHRPQRPRDVELDSDWAAPHDAAPDAGLDADALRDRSGHVRRALAIALRSLSPDDRQLLRMRFGDGMHINRIAVQTDADARSLYRRFDALLRRLRRALSEQALTMSGIRPLLGHVEFGIESVLTESSRQHP
jgi:RNA polymerase sigma factor for flagellar operon FliA